MKKAPFRVERGVLFFMGVHVWWVFFKAITRQYTPEKPSKYGESVFASRKRNYKCRINIMHFQKYN